MNAAKNYCRLHGTFYSIFSCRIVLNIRSVSTVLVGCGPTDTQLHVTCAKQSSTFALHIRGPTVRFGDEENQGWHKAY
jgi:hypothetical protein